MMDSNRTTSPILAVCDGRPNARNTRYRLPAANGQEIFIFARIRAAHSARQEPLRTVIALLLAVLKKARDFACLRVKANGSYRVNPNCSPPLIPRRSASLAKN